MAELPLITAPQRRARLALRHRLAPSERTDDVAAITDSLTALHSADPVTPHLAAGMRMADPSIAAVEAALYEDRSVVRHHGMRRTLWVFTPETTVDAHASSTIRVGNHELKRHLKMLDWEPSRFAEAVGEVADLMSENPISTKEVGGRLPYLNDRLTIGKGKSYETSISILSWALLHAGFEGRTIRARPDSWNTSQYRWVAPWIGFPTEEGRHAGMLRRYLERFGPATETDLFWWTGWNKTPIRKALAELEAVEVALEVGTGWVLPDDLDPAEEPEPWLAVLPGLDPTTMGWKERDWYLDPALLPRVSDRNGNLGPTIWADGRIVGGWAQRPDGEIAYELYEPVDESLLAVEIERLRALVGEDRFKHRFPSPNQKELLG